MNTSLTLFERSIQLHRYPKHQQHQSWQAWDAADEYLIEHCQQLSDEQKQGLQIFNDDFGALATWFHQYQPSCYSDSWVGQKASLQNLLDNRLEPEAIRLCSSMDQAIPSKLVLLKVPKTTALLEHQLIQLQQVVTTDTQIIAAGKAKVIQKSTLALFEKYLGPTHTSLAKKKSRLIFCQPDGQKQHNSTYPTRWQLENSPFTISNHANVFARQQLDIGARFMLQHLPDSQGKTLIDLGCGNGVLGLNVLASSDNTKVIFVDESHMAIASAQENVQHNLSEQIIDAEFLLSNCLEELGTRKVDQVLCNPPFHQQNAITDHIAWQMFKDAYQCLHKGGELRIVGNRHLDYPAKLKRLFGGYNVVASNNKFSILSATKR